MGFQHMLPVVHQAASSKGGRQHSKPKGLSALSKERRSEIASLGGKARNSQRFVNQTEFERHENTSSKGTRETQVDNGDSGANLADILASLEVRNTGSKDPLEH